MSHLLTASTTGLPLRISMLATSRSCGVTPERRSATIMIQSAESIAICACWRIWASKPSSICGSIPPVSTSKKLCPVHSHSQKIRSLVTPGVSSTIAMRWPVNLLKMVDLPTLGRPTIATMGFAILIPPFRFARHAQLSKPAFPDKPGSSRRHPSESRLPGTPALRRAAAA